MRGRAKALPPTISKNTKRESESCKEDKEPNGSLMLPRFFRHPGYARKRATHVKGVAKEDVKQGKKRRDFFAGQGRPKRPPGDVHVYVEERRRRTDAA